MGYVYDLEVRRISEIGFFVYMWDDIMFFLNEEFYLDVFEGKVRIFLKKSLFVILL